MASAAVARLRRKLQDDQPVYGLWVTLDAPAVTELAVACGLDWIVVDAEHGQLDWGDVVGHLRAAVRSNTVTLVRIAELNGGLIKRALDLGADGVVVPWVETADQLRQAVAFSRYPPEGQRGIGAERATGWGQTLAEYVATANDDVLVVPIIETVRAGENIDEMLDVAGVDLYYFGPADYSSTAGFRGQWEGPGVAEAILLLQEKIRARGKHGGVVAVDQHDLARRREQGFRMIGLGLDAELLLRSLRQMLPVACPSEEADTSPAAVSSAINPLPRPPEQLRPDRDECMVTVAAASVGEIAPGVVFRCQVGAHNAARKLTTGIVELQPGAVIPHHTHPFGESLTVLSGRVMVEVEGRQYRLGTLDHISVPAGRVHAAHNIDATKPAMLHAAMAAETVSRHLAETIPAAQPVPDDSSGHEGGERVIRFHSAKRYSPGPGTEFIDFCNHDLLPGFEMSGGYGRFAQGGRLPAHVHDFDESICIIEGEAACVVEGRTYRLSESATALQPRGRVHYFRNDAPQPMAMIWFYAGPMPERIVVDERCATLEGNPWKTSSPYQ